MGNYYPLEDGFQNFVSLGAWEQFHVETSNYRCLAQNLAYIYQVIYWCTSQELHTHIYINTKISSTVLIRLQLLLEGI